MNVSQFGHYTCLRPASGQRCSGPGLVCPCRTDRGVNGCESDVACQDGHHSRGHGRNRDHLLDDRADGRAVLGCRNGESDGRRNGLSRERRGGLGRGSGGDRLSSCPHSERGTGGYRVGRGGHRGAVSSRGESDFVCGSHRRNPWMETLVCFDFDVCRFGQHHRFVQSEAGELPLRFPLHPS